MKYFLAALLGAALLFFVVTATGAFWGGMVGSAHFFFGQPPGQPVTWDQRVGGAMLGAIVFMICGGLPGAAIGALLGPIVVRNYFSSQDTRRSPE